MNNPFQDILLLCIMYKGFFYYKSKLENNLLVVNKIGILLNDCYSVNKKIGKWLLSQPFSR